MTISAGVKAEADSEAEFNLFNKEEAKSKLKELLNNAINNGKDKLDQYISSRPEAANEGEEEQWASWQTNSLTSPNRDLI